MIRTKFAMKFQCQTETKTYKIVVYTFGSNGSGYSNFEF